MRPLRLAKASSSRGGKLAPAPVAAWSSARHGQERRRHSAIFAASAVRCATPPLSAWTSTCRAQARGRRTAVLAAATLRESSARTADSAEQAPLPTALPRRRFWRSSTVVAGAAAAAAAAAAVAAALEPGDDEDELPRVYDQQRLEAYFARRPWAVRRRRAEVASEVLPFAARLAWSWRSGALRDDAACHRYACEARELLARLGPAFIKAGQAMSIRPDLIPPVALKELQRLCDDCPEESWETMRERVEAELGSEVWSKLQIEGLDQADSRSACSGSRPVAAASLGQVYRWRHIPSGRLVAVKVQRPGVCQSVALDIIILRDLAFGIRALVRRFTKNRTDHVALVEAWAKGTYSELDYEAEAANQEHFQRELRQRVPSILVPDVCRDLTTRRVLATQWIDGKRLADCPPAVVRELVPVGVECFLAQLLDMGVFHSDPHPGNLLVSDGRLVLLDFGLVARIGGLSMERMATATVNLISANYDELFDDLVALELLPEDAERSQVLPPLRRVLEQGMRAGSDIRRRAKNFQAVSDDLATIFYELPFQVPDYFALITRALAVLEGIALVGNPEFDIFWAAYPHALSRATAVLGRRRTGVVSAQLARAALRDMTAERRAELVFGRGGGTSAPVLSSAAGAAA
eukprot:TRINITY_DN16155_c0_g1_i1.p1 TRINITY_DN16155_c0_g1~~TRINITY_DN16155_c0_g1_i1.p1  ORF type:complete len:637 (-),score=131.96 TRINITY_DN16155_c0_g1_i1:535-2445(-)